MSRCFARRFAFLSGLPLVACHATPPAPSAAAPALAAPSASAGAPSAPPLAASASTAPAPAPPSTQSWILDNTATFAGLPLTLIGAPQVVDSPQGKALCFDGDDGVVVEKNPLEGLAAFTLEVLVRFDGVTETAQTEPRYLHVQAADGARAMMEGRVNATEFYLDTVLRAGDARLTLIEKTRTHPVGRWTWTALTYESGRMRHFVEGVEDASGSVTFPAMGPGKTSLGVRQNLVHYLRGCIREVRVTPVALAPESLSRIGK